MQLIATIVGALVGALLIGLVFALPGAFFLMLLIGAVHSVLPALPAFGFGTSLAIYLIAKLLFTDASVPSNN